MTIKVNAGNVVRSSVVFVPSTGTVSLADVTCRAMGDNRTVYSLTVVSDGTNAFHADVTVPDTAPAARWVFRWESRSPSPVITLDDETTQFDVVPSAFPAP